MSPIVVRPDRPPSRIVDPAGPIELRAPEVQHAGPLVEAIDESLPALKQFMPWAHLPHGVDEQYTRLAGVVAAFWRGEDYNFHLFDPRTDRLLGCMGLHRRAMNPRAIEMGYWVRTRAAGEGVCTRAARALLVVAYEHFGLRRVQCGYDAANAASARVAAKVGYRVEGRLVGYGPAGDEAMRADGWVADEVNVMCALQAEEARALPWYAEVRDRVEIYDWLGRRV